MSVTGSTQQLNPQLLADLEALSRKLHKPVTIGSGYRSTAHQAQLYAARASNPNPVAPPGSSLHEAGDAADGTAGGVPLGTLDPALLRSVGLYTVPKDAPHVQIYPLGVNIAAARRRDHGAGGSKSLLGAVVAPVGDVLHGKFGAAPGIDALHDAPKNAAGDALNGLWGEVGSSALRGLLYVLFVFGGLALSYTGVRRLTTPTSRTA